MARDAHAPLPRQRIDLLLGPLERFLRVEAAGGVVLLLCTALALGLANSPWSEAWLGVWKTPFSIGIGRFGMSHPLKHWINDGLMAIFFFVIGLEVKRELVLGELRDPRRAALPIAAAAGGMLVPAGIYLGLVGAGPAAAGWGIPMATDIAFVVGCLALLGRRVPLSLRVMLLSLAIADDIGAIAVIAIGYTKGLDFGALALGVVGLAGVYLLARVGVRSLLVYALLAAAIWIAFHESGVHASIEGVALGLLTPSHARASQADEAVSPLEYLEARLHPWVGFGIMPLFALANAGVPLDLGAFGSSVALAVAAGLVVGKPLGIVAFSWLAVRLRIASLPPGVGWGALLGAGALAGIGFTMALFIAELALEGPLLVAAKLGTLSGSAVAAALGLGLLAWLLPADEKSLPREEPAA